MLVKSKLKHVARMDYCKKDFYFFFKCLRFVVMLRELKVCSRKAKYLRDFQGSHLGGWLWAVGRRLNRRVPALPGQPGSWSSTFPQRPTYLSYQLFRKGLIFYLLSLVTCVHWTTDALYDPGKCSNHCWDVCCPLLNSSGLRIPALFFYFLRYLNFLSRCVLYLSYETLFAYALVRGCRNSLLSV